MSNTLSPVRVGIDWPESRLQWAVLLLEGLIVIILLAMLVHTMSAEAAEAIEQCATPCRTR